MQKGKPHCKITPKSTCLSKEMKKSLLLLGSFVFYKMLRNKHCRTWSSVLNLWIDSRTYQKKRILLSARQASSNYLEPFSKENVLGEYDAVTLTILYLKVLYDIVSQNS